MSVSWRLWGLVAGLLLTISSGAHAATIFADSNDFESQHRSNNGGYFVGNPQTNPDGAVVFRTGTQANFAADTGNGLGGIEGVYWFAMPVLAPNEQITAATFSVGIGKDPTTGVLPTFNADLYVLGFRNTASSKTVTDATNFFFVGPSQSGSISGMSGTLSKVQDNYLVPTDFVSGTGTAPSTPKVTDTGGSTNLLAYINDLYANTGTNGFVPGTSIIAVRLTPDYTAPSGTQRYSTLTDATATTSLKPQITLTTEVVPEPVGLASLLIGGVALGSRRRRI